MSAPATLAPPPKRRFSSPTTARALRFGRTRIGIVVTAAIVLVALIGPVRRSRTTRPRSSASRSSRPRATSRWARTTSATTCSRACSGAAAASSGWRSRQPRSASGSGRRSACSRASAGRRLDDGLMRSMDVILAFPQIVLVLLFVSMLGSHLSLIVALVALAWVPQVARVARGVTADIVHREYVQAAEADRAPAAPHPLPRDPAERRDAADGRVRAAPHLVDRRDRGGQLPRLRHSAAERRLGPDDQREPRRDHAASRGPCSRRRSASRSSRSARTSSPRASPGRSRESAAAVTTRDGRERQRAARRA